MEFREWELEKAKTNRSIELVDDYENYLLKE